jgi:uncharacterized protein
MDWTAPIAWLKAGAVGFVSGVLSGMFGIGGGVITTPAIRLVLGGSAISAVATPLPVIIPTAITGGLSYSRRGLSDVRAGLQLGAWGALAAVGGAFLAGYVGGSALLLATAALIAWMAVDMARQAAAPDEPAGAAARVAEGDARAMPMSGPAPRFSATPVPLAVLGLVTGLYSGLLGLGGGFVMVPVLSRWFGFPVKRAVGTSLIAIAVLAIPGTITHYLLGHIDAMLALALSVTVIPGSLIGAKITSVASDRAVRIGFAALLAFAGIVLVVNEIGALR